MQGREAGGVRGRRVVVTLLVVTLAVAGVLVVRAAWPEAPAPILTDVKRHPPAPADPGGGTRPCAADQLDVRLAADRTTVSTGQPVVFTVTLENSGVTPCLVDGGDANRPVTVWSGEPGPDADRVWSSGDCGDAGERMLLLGSGSVDTQDVRWSDVRSAPGCEQVEGDIEPGTYSAQVTVADVEGAASQVVQLTRPSPPTPTPSPSPSPSSGGSPSPSGSGAPEPGPSASGSRSESAPAEPALRGPVPSDPPGSRAESGERADGSGSEPSRQPSR